MRWLVILAFAGCGRLGFDDIAAGASDATPIAVDSASGPSFLDTFDRPDQAGVGNNWVEHDPGVFSIANHEVHRVVQGDWTTNMVSQPPDGTLDLEIAMEFVVTDTATPDWPQIFVRGIPANFDGYYLWVDTGPSATDLRPLDLARKPDDQSWWTPLATTMVPTATVGSRYRLRLRATGAHPVHLQAWYEIFDGSAWSSSITLTADDNDPDALVDPGVWGFDGHTGSTGGPYVYDNFSMTKL